MQDMRSRKKAQSAMEYIMTYGWAILIMGVVLAALFQLGVFSSINFVSKVQAGACQVYRPYGPWTVSLIALTGECNGGIPQYVAESGLGYIKTNTIPLLNQFTVLAWISNGQSPSGTSGDALLQGDTYLPRSAASYSVEMDTNGGLKYTSNGLQAQPIGSAQLNNLQYGQWYMIAQTVDPTGNVVTYAYLSGSTTPQTISYNYANALYQPSGKWCIGSWACSLATYPFNGFIANVQLYNASLSANEIQLIYEEGLAGPPLVLQNLVGWWPLNGNAQDYSGNKYNALTANVGYFTTWINNYTAP